jgi:hypothetical protein
MKLHLSVYVGPGKSRLETAPKINSCKMNNITCCLWQSTDTVA